MACQSAAKVHVDCSTAQLRTAVFTPTSPFVSGLRYVVVVNPEHHLGLTDLAGNPMARSALLFVTP